jgi:hypothetical protein
MYGVPVLQDFLYLTGKLNSYVLKMLKPFYTFAMVTL